MFCLDDCVDVLCLKLEMAQEAAQKIRRYYRNNYRYGSGAKTICKWDLFWKKMYLYLNQSKIYWCHSQRLFSRLGSWRFRRLGIQPRHQVLLHIRAPGSRAVWLPAAAISHSQGLQWSTDRREDHRPQGYRENTGANKSCSSPISSHTWL